MGIYSGSTNYSQHVGGFNHPDHKDSENVSTVASWTYYLLDDMIDPNNLFLKS